MAQQRTGIVVPLLHATAKATLRWKQIVTTALEARFCAVERTPPKRAEMRVEALSQPSWLLAGADGALGDLPGLKFARHLRRNSKLRLFRIFKLLSDSQKRDPVSDPAAAELQYRPLADRLRTLGFLRRL